MYKRSKRCASLFVLFVGASLCLLVAAPAPTSAQTTNPKFAACGLPTQGTILVSVTYTLIADCTQTGDITLNPGVSLTINGGGGFTIRGGGAFGITSAHTNNTLNLNNVTFDNEGAANPTIVSVLNNTTLTVTNVTFRGGSDGAALNVAGTASATLTKVLFENNRISAWGSGGNASGLNIKGNATVTMTDAVFRNHRVGGGAIVVQGSGSLTAKGCLSFSGNVPYDVGGTWTNSSSGACTGTIGNGGSATITAPALLPCGLPAPGSLDSSAAYTLHFDCDLGRSGQNVEWRIAQDVTISIQGNGHTLRGGSGSNYMEIWQAGGGSLTIENLVVEHVTFYPFGAATVNRSAFRSSPYLIFYLLGTADIRNSVFENLRGSSNSANALLTWSPYGRGHAIITDTIFRNNNSAGTGPVLNTFGSGTITLNGCISFEDNAPANFPAGANIVDNSIGPCDKTTPVGPPDPVSVSLPAPIQKSRSSASTNNYPADCFQRLGEVGLICRRHDAERTLEIWSIDENSEGHFVTAFTPAEVAALPQAGMFEASPDGRVACRVIGSRCVVRSSQGDSPRVSSAECIASELTDSGGEIGTYRHLAISMGPNREDKVYTVVLDNDGHGQVIGTVDTFTGLPGVPRETADASEPATPASALSEQQIYAQPVQPQPARADGSIIHVVQPGDTVWQIGIAYNVHPFKIIALNKLDRLKNRGQLIFPGQKLIVRDA